MKSRKTETEKRKLDITAAYVEHHLSDREAMRALYLLLGYIKKGDVNLTVEYLEDILSDTLDRRKKGGTENG